MGTALDEMDFAVIDVETTGLYPRGHDRIIEIAIVRLMAGKRLSEEFVTLVNPGRDLGPTPIHGITAEDIVAAPQFADVAGDVLASLADAVVVAHNVRFDTAFLVAECSRVGVTLPDFPRLCTLRMATILGNGFSGRTLSDCCGHFGIEVGQCHTAADDARACARLLGAYLDQAERLGIYSLDDLAGSSSRLAATWPQLPRSGKALRRSEAQRLREIQPNYLARLVTRLMGTGPKKLSPDVSAYMGLLDKVLEDRLVVDTEAETLHAFAREYGLDGEQVVSAHRGYLEDLARAALADGIVTESEERDLLKVTKLLGFDRDTLNSALDEARRTPAKYASAAKAELSGKSVCFTGTLIGRIDGEHISRELAHELAEKAGLIVAKSVTKKLDVLVVADPLTLSRKAEKARDYGTRIIAEMAFWKTIGVSVD